MDVTLDAWLPPWFAISNSALKGNSLKKFKLLLKLIILYSTQNGCGLVCVPCAMWLPVSLWRRVLSWDSLPTISLSPSQLMYQIKKFWVKASALYEQLLTLFQPGFSKLFKGRGAFWTMILKSL